MEVCDECLSIINDLTENIYILQKSDDERLWCLACFEELWEEYSCDGWFSDDIDDKILG